MYKRHTGQVSMLETPEMFGSLPLNPKNDWIRLSKLVPWYEFDRKYRENFRSKKGQPAIDSRMALGALLIGIVFSEGGYFRGHDVVEITSDENGHHSVYSHYPDVLDGIGAPYTTDLTEDQWKRLMDTLFKKLCVHEWKKHYVDLDVCDGTQWGLKLKLTKGRHYDISGSNDFPALYKDLVRAFKPYMKKPEGKTRNGNL